MRPKTTKEIFKIDENPGPGTYVNFDSFRQINTKASNSFKKSCVPKIQLKFHRGPNKFDRVPGPDPNKPGAADYNMNPQTIYGELSKSTARRGEPAKIGYLGNAERLTYFKVKTYNPGPGEYRASSAFGQYQSKHVNTYRSTTSSSRR